jgi:hypothetical protein
MNVSDEEEATVRTLMAPTAWVAHNQIYVADADAAQGDSPTLDQCFGGQRNGLCGAAVPGFLFLTTGLHTGEVGFTVELHDGPPPAGDSWEEIVEASFRTTGDVELVAWGAQDSWPLDIDPGSYRVRYCATGMDEGHDRDTRMDGEPEADRYLLQFWPAPPAPDAVIKQTSEMAAYWHEWAREMPVVPPPPSAEELEAERRRRAAERDEEAEREFRQFAEALVGAPPSGRLRDVPHAGPLGRLDRPLTAALGEADPATQRRIARWATRRACEEAELAGIDWIAAALDAMDRGEPLPRPFEGGYQDARNALRADPRAPHATVVSLDGRHPSVVRSAMAFPALWTASEEDPLTAAVAALWFAATAFGRDRYPVLFAEARQAFPALRMT